MSFCPKCKAEYINGRSDCADCKVLLVETLSDIINEDAITNLQDIEEEVFEEEIPTIEDEEPKKERIYTFVSKKEKYKDYLSTAYTFVIIGFIGLVIITLNLLGIISVIKTSGVSAILFYGVMYATLLIFIGVGIHSFVTSNKMKSAIATEDAFLTEINQFITDKINNSIFTEDYSLLSPEEIYFQKTEIIKSILYTQFPDISPSLMEELVDKAYDSLT